MKARFAKSAIEWFLRFGFAGMFATPLIWAYQIIHWLRFGTWPGITVAAGLHWAGMSAPHVRWASVQRMSSLVMSLPLSISIFFASVGLLVVAMQWADTMTKPYDERAMDAVRKVSN